MWYESSSETGERLADIRVKDAVELGAEILTTACPLCVLTLEDAVKTTGNEDKLKIMDVTELLAMAIGK
jgi:Fe-S oxidoreductase